MDPNLPSIPELAQLQFMDPGSNAMAGQQIDLANQFANNRLQQNQADLQTTLMNNQFQQQNDPTRLAQGLATLQTSNLNNTAQQFTNDVNSSTKDEQIAAKRAKYVADLSDEQLKDSLNTAQKWMLSDDPEKQQKGSDMYMRSAAEQSARAKALDTQDNTRIAIGGKVDVAKVNAGAKIAGLTLTAESAERINNLKDATQRQAILAKLQMAPPSVLAAQTTAAAMRTTDDTERAQLLEQANIYQKMAIEAKTPPAGISIPATSGLPSAASQVAPIAVPASAVRKQGTQPVPGNAPNGAGGAGNQTPPIANEVFNQNSGNPATVPQQSAQQQSDILAIQKELSDPRIKPEVRKVLQQQLQATLNQAQSAPPPQAAPAAAAPAPSQAAPAIPPQGAGVPQGRVEVFQNGKSAGTIPAAQVQTALKKGYTLQ